MKIIALFLFLIMTSFYACNSDKSRSEKEPDEKVADKKQEIKEDTKEKNKTLSSEMATEVCNCLSTLGEEVSDDAKRIFKKVMDSDNPEETAAAEMEKLDESKRAKIDEELNTLINSMESNPQVTECMQKLSKKYKDKPDDEDAMLKQLVSNMEKEEGCDMAAGLFKAYMKKADAVK